MTQNSDKLTDLLMAWEEAWEKGEKLTTEELCADCPEFEEPLREMIRRLLGMSWMSKTSDSPEDNEAANPFLGITLAGRYHTEALIGKGGFGWVYRCFDNELQRYVALKIARTDRRQDPEQLLYEARRAAKLKHAAIVAIHDVGRHDGSVFIVSDLIDGRNLADVLMREKPEFRQIAEWIAEVADALHVAHSQNFVHCDIKPLNILIDQDDHAHVTDFGISATIDQIRDNKTISSGTLAYMAPEQLEADTASISPQTDVFGLGVVFYELLTGKHPFGSDRQVRMLEQILHTEPKPIPANVPEHLVRICLRCLKKDPLHRFGTAKELAEALRAHPKPIEAPRNRSRRQVLMTGMACTVTLAWFWDRIFRDWTKTIDVPKGTRDKRNFTVSPDSRDAPEPVPEVPPVKGINLLERIDPRQHTIHGTWELVNGELHAESPMPDANGTGAVIRIPYRPEGDYKIRCIARRKEGKGLVLPIVHSGRQFGVFLSGGQKGSYIPELGPEGTKAEVDFFPTSNDNHVIELTVTGKGFRVESDNGAVFEWNGDYGMAIARPSDIPDSESLFLKVSGRYVVKQLELIE